MGKKGPSVPSADEQAKAQSAANRDAIEATYEYGTYDRIYGDPENPYYSTTYTKEDGSNIPTAEIITPGGGVKEGIDKQIALQNALLSYGQDRLSALPTDDFEAPQFNYTAPDFGDRIDQLQKTIYDSQMEYLRPEMERQNRTYFNRLDQQGLPVDSAAYNTAYDRAMDQNDQTYSQASRSALIDAMNYGLQYDQYDFNKALTTHQQNTSDAYAARQQPISEALSAITGAPQSVNPVGPQMPVMPVQPVNMQGIYANQIAQQQAQAQAQGGLFDLLGTIGGFAIGGPAGAAAGKNIFGYAGSVY